MGRHAAQAAARGRRSAPPLTRGAGADRESQGRGEREAGCPSTLALHCPLPARPAEEVPRAAKPSSRIINTRPSTRQSLSSIFKRQLRSLPFPSSSLSPHLPFACHHIGVSGQRGSGHASALQEIPPWETLHLSRFRSDGHRQQRCRRQVLLGLERGERPRGDRSSCSPPGFTTGVWACTDAERGFPTAHPESAAAPPPHHAAPPRSLLRTPG